MQNKKKNCLHKIKYLWLLCWRKKRKIIKKSLKIIWEIIYYGFLYICGFSFVYDSYPEAQVPLWILSIVLLFLLVEHKQGKSDYKIWINEAKHDEFYKNFTWNYKLPLLLPRLILTFIFAKWCSIGSFIILYFLMSYMDLSNRRYHTNIIKQEMILKKLEERWR